MSKDEFFILVVVREDADLRRRFILDCFFPVVVGADVSGALLLLLLPLPTGALALGVMVCMVDGALLSEESVVDDPVAVFTLRVKGAMIWLPAATIV